MLTWAQRFSHCLEFSARPQICVFPLLNKLPSLFNCFAAHRERNNKYFVRMHVCCFSVLQWIRSELVMKYNLWDTALERSEAFPGQLQQLPLNVQVCSLHSLRTRYMYLSFAFCFFLSRMQLFFLLFETKNLIWFFFTMPIFSVPNTSVKFAQNWELGSSPRFQIAKEQTKRRHVPSETVAAALQWHFHPKDTLSSRTKSTPSLRQKRAWRASNF